MYRVFSDVPRAAQLICASRCSAASSASLRMRATAMIDGGRGEGNDVDEEEEEEEEEEEVVVVAEEVAV